MTQVSWSSARPKAKVGFGQNSSMGAWLLTSHHCSVGGEEQGAMDVFTWQGETEAERGRAGCPASLSWWVVEPQLDPDLPGAGPLHTPETMG